MFPFGGLPLSLIWSGVAVWACCCTLLESPMESNSFRKADIRKMQIRLEKPVNQIRVKQTFRT